MIANVFQGHVFYSGSFTEFWAHHDCGERKHIFFLPANCAVSPQCGHAPTRKASSDGIPSSHWIETFEKFPLGVIVR